MPNLKKKVENPNEAFEVLKEGNTRFTSNLKLNRNYMEEVYATKDGQQPFAVVISCMDSRTPTELIFDQGIGDIFSVRIAGNIATQEVIASCEYACHVVGASLIVVLGHYGCGAVNGALNKVKLGHLHTITDRINETINESRFQRSVDNLNSFSEENVKAQVKALGRSSEILNKLHEDGKVRTVGGIYDVSTGIVRFFDLFDVSGAAS